MAEEPHLDTTVIVLISSVDVEEYRDEVARLVRR